MNKLMKFRNMALGLMLSAAPVAGFASNDSQSILSSGAKAVTATVSVDKGKIRDAGIKEGFIITYINNSPVASPQDVAAEVKKARRSLLIEGFDPSGDLYYFGIGL